MHDQRPTERSYQASITAFVVAFLAIACFIPPLSRYVGSHQNALIAAALGITIGVAYCAHFIFLGMTVAHMHRSVIGWLALAILLGPLGSILAFVVLGFRGAERGWRFGENDTRVV
ncbi:MAG: hypothetical protein ACR2GP_16045 [Burkholderiaceae bacterium]